MAAGRRKRERAAWERFLAGDGGRPPPGVKATDQGRAFRHKGDALGRAVVVHVCQLCGTGHEAGATRTGTWAAWQPGAACLYCGGVEFFRMDSRLEAKRYAQLRLELQVGTIRELRVHPEFPLFVSGRPDQVPVKAAVYTPDFVYLRGLFQNPEDLVVEDVKGSAKAAHHSRDSALRRRLFEAAHGVKVTIWTGD